MRARCPAIAVVLFVGLGGWAARTALLLSPPFKRLAPPEEGARVSRPAAPPAWIRLERRAGKAGSGKVMQSASAPAVINHSLPAPRLPTGTGARGADRNRGGERDRRPSG